jgi:hypothetical protein
VTWSVYQHWDPLRVCIVGRSYPPEFYSWITVPHVRDLFERIAIETEEDYQNIIKKLESFKVKVLRPDLPTNVLTDGVYTRPPMTPRDYTIMIGEQFYSNVDCIQVKIVDFYSNVKDPQWPSIDNDSEFYQLPEDIQNECIDVHQMLFHTKFKMQVNNHCYDRIIAEIKMQGNSIKTAVDPNINGAMISRIGKDLYFGTHSYTQDTRPFEDLCQTEFSNTRNHIVNTGGHSDATYCPVCPGLIISLNDVPTYAETFPDWEVVYLPGQSWNSVKPFLQLKKQNEGKWWILGFEHDLDVVNTIETWLGHWTGYVEETVFDVNMLIVDPKNVIVFNYNKQVFDALDRYGITPHVVPFRHRYFWDGGIHCITSDLHREGVMQDYFPNRI